MRAMALRPKMKARWGVGPQIVMVLLIVGLFGGLAVEPTRQLLEQRARISGTAAELDQIEVANERLEGRVARLKDPDFLEQRARTQIGLVRPGETAFIVMPPSSGGKSGSNKRSKPEPTTQPPPGFIEGFLSFLGLP